MVTKAIGILACLPLVMLASACSHPSSTGYVATYSDRVACSAVLVARANQNAGNPPGDGVSQIIKDGLKAHDYNIRADTLNMEVAEGDNNTGQFDSSLLDYEDECARIGVTTNP